MKNYLFIISFLIFSAVISAQTKGNNNALGSSQNQNDKGFDPSKLSFGGGFGLGFGSDNYFGFSLNPQVGYNFSNKFTAGLGVSYSYSKENNTYWSGIKWKYSRNYVGVNLFANYYPIPKLVVTARPEIIRMWQNYTETDGGISNKYSSTDVIPTLVVGAGVRLRPLLLTLNYDLIQNSKSPYGENVFFNVGILF